MQLFLGFNQTNVQNIEFVLGRYPTPEVNRKLLLELGSHRNTTRSEGIDPDEEEEQGKTMTLL